MIPPDMVISIRDGVFGVIIIHGYIDGIVG